MHILYLTSETIPGCDGGSVRTMEIAVNLARLGHQVDVMANAGPGQTEKEVISGIKMRRIRQTVLGRALPLLSMKKFFSFLRRDYDIVLESFSALGGTGVFVSLVKDIPLVLDIDCPHTEEVISRYRLRNPIKGPLRGWRRLQFRLSSLLLASTPSIIPKLSRSKAAPRAIGANVELFQSELGASRRVKRLKWTHNLEGKTVVVFCGSFRWWDGVDSLAEIADRTVRENKDVRFLMIGEGDLADELRKQVASRGIGEYVVFAGRRPYHEVPYLLSCADIAIAPFGVEGHELLQRFGFYWMPIKIFEYMAAGLPTVTFDYDCLRKVLGGNECGVLVPPGNMAAMTEAILALSADPGRREVLGRNARQRAEREYSWRSQARRLEKLFEDLLKKNPQGPRLF